jgi:chromosome segregation ATPase
LSKERVDHSNTKLSLTEAETLLLRHDDGARSEAAAFEEVQRAQGDSKELAKKLANAEAQLKVSQASRKSLEKELSLNHGKLESALAAANGGGGAAGRQRRADEMVAKDKELREAKAQLQHLISAITGGGGGGGGEDDASITLAALTTPTKGSSGGGGRGSPSSPLSPRGSASRAQGSELAAASLSPSKQRELVSRAERAEAEVGRVEAEKGAMEVRMDKVEKALVRASAMHRGAEERAELLEGELAFAREELEKAQQQAVAAATEAAEASASASVATAAVASAEAAAAAAAVTSKNSSSKANDEDERRITERALELERELESALGQIDSLEKEAGELKGMIDSETITGGQRSAPSSPTKAGARSPGGRNKEEGDVEASLDDGDDLEGDGDEGGDEAAIGNVDALQV